MAAAIAVRVARADAAATTRAAIVIGVDQPGTLPKLRAAAAGAHMMADWLQGEGFTVKRFTDDAAPVSAADIFKAIDEFVGLGTVEQLVVYFAGHGYVVGYAEYWLLSGAPHNPNEAISLDECNKLSRQCGIPNVVFISDACRSTTDSLGAQFVKGSVVFPTDINNAQVHTEVDRFLATRVGHAAFEVKVAEKDYQGLYTSCFLDAYKHPDADMVEMIAGIAVVPNRKLETFLVHEMVRRALATSPALSQDPDAIVESDRYIGRATSPPSPQPQPPTARVTISDVVGRKLQSVIGFTSESRVTAPLPDASIDALADRSGFSRNRDLIAKSQGPGTFDLKAGINVFGTRVRAVASSSVGSKLLREGGKGDEPAVIEVDPRGRRQGSVALRFDDGSGTVIAALNGYMANVVVDGGGVASVSYAPARTGGISDAESQRLAQLHALVATSARFGVFRIDGSRETRAKNAERLADTIRVEKTTDPTLGLYAAYAYADAGMTAQVRSVYENLKGGLGVVLFDIAMLAGVLTGSDHSWAAPFWPMLAQGWGLLRVNKVALSHEIADAQGYLRPALWATYEEKGMEIAMSALSRGVLP